MLEWLRNFLVLIPLAVWFGGAIAVAFFTAPVVFKELASRTLAGEVMGVIFARLRLVEYFTMAALLAAEGIKYAALPSLRSTREYWLTALIVAFVLVQLFSVGVVSPKVASLQAQIDSFDETPQDDPLRQAFSLWHGISMMSMTLALALCFAILLLYFVPLKSSSPS